MPTLTAAMIDPAVLDQMTADVVNGRRAHFEDDPLYPPSEDPQIVFERNVGAAVERHLMRIPALYWPARFARLDATQRPELLQEWICHEEAQTLFLAGDYGAGKTYAAAAVANEAAVTCLRHDRKVVPVRWWSVAGLLSDLRNPDRSAKAWEHACVAPLLVLDDLAHTRPTDWAVEQMWMLTDFRATAGRGRLMQVITTNATWQTLADTWGRATMDRLRDGAAIVGVTGESRREPLVLGGAG